MALGDSFFVVGDHPCPTCGRQMSPVGLFGNIFRWRCTRHDCNAVGKMVDNLVKLAERTTDTEEE